MQITGGIYNSRKIKTPEYKNIKPTLSKTRQGIFNTLAAMISFEGKLFVDMFAGSGIMSIEAISRGFNTVLFEKDIKTAAAIKTSFSSLGLNPELYVGDSVKKLPTLNIKPDVIFLDPPYDSDLYEKSLKMISETYSEKKILIIAEHPASKKIGIPEKITPVKVKTYGDKQISFFETTTNQEE